MIGAWMERPRGEGDGGGGRGSHGEGPGSESGPGGGRVSGTIVVAAMLAVTVALWGGFTWLAAGRFDGLHVVTFRSAYPGEVRVLALPFGDERRWSVAFLERYPPAASLARDEWIAARTDAAWLGPGFFSGRSLHPAGGEQGCTYRVQLRGGPGSGAEEPIVHVHFPPREETRLEVDAQGRLHVTAGALVLPELPLLSAGPVAAGEWPGQRQGSVPSVPGPDDPLLPELSGLVFADDGDEPADSR